MPAKKRLKVNKSLLGAVGAATLGVVAGAAAIFLSKKENRVKVKNAVDNGVRRGKVELAKAQKQVKALEKKGAKALSKARKSFK